MKEDLETVVDRLLDYVKTNGRVNSSAAAQALGMKREQVERLAQILEENGLLEVRYGIAETVILDKKPPKPPAAPKSKDQVIADSQALGDEATLAGNLTAFFEHDISRRIQRAEAMLDSIERSKEFTKDELDEVRRELDIAISQLSRFSDEIKRLQEVEAHFYERLFRFKSVINQISPLDTPKRKGVFDSLAGGFSFPWQKPSQPKPPVSKETKKVEPAVEKLELEQADKGPDASKKTVQKKVRK